MYTLLTPNRDELIAFARAAKTLPLSTPRDPLRDEPQHQWHDDRYRYEVPIPSVIAPALVRAAARERLRRCDFFPTWMVVARVDEVVAVGARLLGVIGLFADRVIAEHDDGTDEAFTMGFTYATTRGHFETGVESFTITRAGASAPVIFEIHAVSRAANPFKAIVAALFVRRLQRRFGHDTPRRFEAALLTALRATPSGAR